MERSYDERISLYFFKKSRSSALLLIVLGFACGSVGFRRGGIHVFLIIGMVFLLMAAWLLIRQRFIRVKGAEVDAAAAGVMNDASLERLALKDLGLEEDDVEGLPKYILRGYSPSGINTEPLFRWDPEDETPRSSNYQISLFILDEEVFFVYSQVKSLVDSEFYENSRIWRFASVNHAGIEKTAKRCMTAPGKEEGKIEVYFDQLMIAGENNDRYGFAFDENDREKAGCLLEYINKRIQKPKGTNRNPQKKRAVASDLSALSGAEQKSVKIGAIGDHLVEL